MARFIIYRDPFYLDFFYSPSDLSLVILLKGSDSNFEVNIFQILLQMKYLHRI